jgi:GT2 family glycosyltransferase
MSQPPHPAAGTQPSVCVIVLNYNGRRLLGRFLPAIMKTDYAPLEIVVVDNASHDDSCGWLKTRWPQVTLLQETQNRAFAGGNNVGIRYALGRGHRYILIANNDIEPHPSWVREAVAHALAHPRHGVIGFNLFNLDATRPAFETACRNLGPTRWRQAEQVAGAAMFCDAELFKCIGVFDETYRFYSEETDLELRAIAAGWQMAELSVPVWHLGEGSTRKLGLRRAYLQMRNTVRMTFKLNGLLSGLLMIKTVLNRACNPWLKLAIERDYTLSRYRPAGLLTNAVLALAAIGWNLVALPHTIYRGFNDKRMVARYRAREVN